MDCLYTKVVSRSKEHAVRIIRSFKDKNISKNLGRENRKNLEKEEKSRKK